MLLSRTTRWIFAISCLVVTLLLNGSSQGDFGEIVPDWQVRLELARVLSYQKKYDESIHEYQLVLAQQPQLTEAQLELAEVLAYGGRKEESLKLVESLSKKNLDDSTSVRLANIYAILKNYKVAESLYRTYLANHPNDLPARFKYAELLSWEKEYTLAVKEFEILLKARPDDIQLRRKYAMVLIWKGDTQKAKEQLEKSLTTDSE